MEEQDENIVFQNEEEDESLDSTQNAWKILIIDDEEEVHRTTRLALNNFVFEGRMLELISGYSGADAKRLIVDHQDAALVLLDVVMESDNVGLEVVQYLREEADNQFVRIILRTGQPGQAPEQKVVATYDLNGYEEKVTLTAEKLITVVTSSLRAYRDLRKMEDLAMKAEAANHAKSNFLNMVSHELRTPLTVVMGNLGELKSPEILDGSDEIKEIAGDAYEQAEHLLILINDVLDLSKIETGKLQISTRSVAVEESIENALSLTRLLATKKGLVLKSKITPENLNVCADFVRLRQILINLIGNATKFTDHGEIRLIVWRDGEFAVFAIHDTGCGIAPEKQKKVFQAFEQADNSSTRAAGGTGLGLPITQKLVELHGGKIWLESEEGKGTVFTFTIPLA